MIEEHEKEQHVDDLLFDLWNIIETSENSIREIILTDNHWNIIFDINNSPSQENPEELKWIITVCKENWKIESDYYFSLPDLANTPDNKSYITGVHLRQTICWTTRHNNSISAVRRINSKTWLQWFLIIKYRISFFRDFFSQNPTFDKSNIKITNNLWEILYWKDWWSSSDSYHNARFFSERSEPYKLDFSIDSWIAKDTQKANLLGVWSGSIFLSLYFLFFLFYYKRDKELTQEISIKSMELWNMKLKLLENVLESSPYPIFLKDLNWNFLLWNSLFKEFIDFKKDWTNFESHNFHLVYLSPDEYKIHCDMDEKLIKNWNLDPYEIKRQDYYWNIKTFRFNKQIYIDNDWKIRWIIWIIVDISDLENANLKAEQESNAKSEFLANMRHELITPLNAIIWFSDIIKDQIFWENSSKYRNYANDIHKAGEHLLHLIDDILDFSKAESHNWLLDLNLKTEKLIEIVNQSVSLLQDKIDKKNIRLKIVIPWNLQFKMDRMRMKQVIINLISNSIKFTQDNWYIIINAQTIEEGIIKIEIIDNWIWIWKKELEKVKEPFFQGDCSYSKKFEGTGMWLWICNKIITAHWWIFTIESELNIWTTVIIILQDVDYESYIWQNI